MTASGFLQRTGRRDGSIRTRAPTPMGAPLARDVPEATAPEHPAGERNR